jgi:hypothetical protein
MDNKINIIRPSESVHYYDRQGNPVYTVIGKNGKERDTTLADARKLDLVPSVSQIKDMAAKEWLTFYKMKQVLLAALTLPRSKDEPEDEYIKRIIFDSKQAGAEAAELGTRIHAAIQKAYECIIDKEYEDYITRVIIAIHEKYGNQNWICEKSFAHPLNFGGKIDLQVPGFIIDLKTTAQGLKEMKARDHDDNCMQLAAYRIGSGNECAKCANVYISTTTKDIYIKEYTEEELLRGWGMFQDLLNYWKKKKKVGYEIQS